jgi:cellulose synthase/poly-beta-1,6-N-acetylglucosamine synthase-like glycosyltransferase
MIDLLLVPVAIFYLLDVGLLFVYGINFFYLTFLSTRKQPTPGQAPIAEKPPGRQSWPRVTVQLPVYNEMYVAERLVRAAAALDYPADLLEIQALDDSTDETRQILTNAVAELQSQGVQIQHLHRRERTGFKAGALAEGLQRARGEFLAIFDADFIPPPDFLRRTLPVFQDQSIAFVQTRWGHINRNDTLLTFLQSLSIDAHFIVEQHARWQAGFWFNFNGTAGVWRKQAVLDAGGWKAETLTEDLDLSYRSFLRGWKAVYLRDVEVPAELPVSFGAYRRQQHRWARGSLECALKFLPLVWRAPISLRQKIEASLHLTGYYVHILLFFLAFLYPAVLYLTQRYTDLINLFGLAFLFNLTAFAPTVFFLAAQRHLGGRWWKRLPQVVFMTVLGAGMMLNTVRAATQILVNQRNEFERTPKFGFLKHPGEWRQRRYQTRFDRLVLFELAFAVFNLATVLYALRLGNWVIAIYAGLFSAGLAFTSCLTLGQLISVRLAKRT